MFETLSNLFKRRSASMKRAEEARVRLQIEELETRDATSAVVGVGPMTLSGFAKGDSIHGYRAVQIELNDELLGQTATKTGTSADLAGTDAYFGNLNGNYVGNDTVVRMAS